MRKYLILAFISTLSIASFGQNQMVYNVGGYTTLADFQSNTPNYPDTFIVKHRTTLDIKAWGGNDYKVESMNKTIKTKVIKKQLWGIFVNDTLYLNSLQLTGYNWYSKVELFGKYCFLRPAFPFLSKFQKELGLDKNEPNLGFMFGAVGGAIQGAQMAVARISLIYCISDGQKMLLSKKNILALLENYPELKANFFNETTQESEDTLLKYLKYLNEM